MSTHTVGIWMYQNGGGDAIQRKLVERLKERDIDTITGLDLSKAVARQGSVYCNGISMEELDLFYSYNAGEQSPYQVYLYELLDRLIPTINNFRSFMLTEDKFKTSHLLQRHGIRTPEYRLCNKYQLDDVKFIIKDWKDGGVYKPTDGWGGRGIVRIDNEKNLDMLAPFIQKLEEPHFFIERFIKNDFSDFRIDVVDNQFVGCYGRIAPEGQWKTNITSGGSVIQREPNNEVVDTALRAAKATGLEIAGVDLVYDQEHEEYVVLEVNGIPAFATPDQERMGLDFNDRKIEKIVDLIERQITKNKVYTAPASLEEYLYAVK
ncbi:Ribosomal protein S6--L-glutamate ligase [invertebrate metagenome]|uniref:Ribosomal protein S6--L-glutamate ligase n=1 Tax=invertebrate metagenome TaxID=1711999 RepID=A0A2H9TAF0_9ZZZZ